MAELIGVENIRSKCPTSTLGSCNSRNSNQAHVKGDDKK